MNGGYFATWRKVFDNDFLDTKPYNHLAAWLYLINRAQHTEKDIFFNGQNWHLTRGQFVTSVRHLSRKFGWNPKKVIGFIRSCKAQNMVTVTGTPTGTVISILKYDEYQSKEGFTKTEGTDTGTLTGTPRGKGRAKVGYTSNNVNNVNKENKNNPPTPLIGGRGRKISKREAEAAEIKRISQAAIEAARRYEASKKGGGK